jgi:hypothetical protein
VPQSRIFGLLVLCTGFAAQADNFLVQVPAVLHPSAPIAQSVDRECDIETMVGSQVFRGVARTNRGAGQIKDAGNVPKAKVLKLTILSVHGVGGGAWTGAKSITTRVDLTQNGKTLRSAVFTEKGRGSGLRGTCAILERVAFSIGRRVDKWLPTVLDADMAATPGIGVVVPAVFEPAVSIPDDARGSCPLEMLIGSQVFTRVNRHFPGTRMIESSELAAADKAIQVTIAGVQGIGSDAVKGLTLRIDVLQNAKVISTNTFEKSGQTGPIDMSSTCAMLERFGAVIGENAARWLPAVIQGATSGSPDADPEEEKDDAAELPSGAAQEQSGKRP